MRMGNRFVMLCFFPMRMGNRFVMFLFLRVIVVCTMNFIMLNFVCGFLFMAFYFFPMRMGNRFPFPDDAYVNRFFMMFDAMNLAFVKRFRSAFFAYVFLSRFP